MPVEGLLEGAGFLFTELACRFATRYFDGVTPGEILPHQTRHQNPVFIVIQEAQRKALLSGDPVEGVVAHHSYPVEMALVFADHVVDFGFNGADIPAQGFHGLEQYGKRIYFTAVTAGNPLKRARERPELTGVQQCHYEACDGNHEGQYYNETKVLAKKQVQIIHRVFLERGKISGMNPTASAPGL
jgi:hypothetical protein